MSFLACSYVRRQLVISNEYKKPQSWERLREHLTMKLSCVIYACEALCTVPSVLAIKVKGQGQISTRSTYYRSN